MISILAKLPTIGRYFFVSGLLAIGVEHFVFKDFIVGRAPQWPQGLPGQLIWAYITGIFFIVACLLILLKIKARIVSLSCVALIFVWAFIRHLPVLFSEMFLSGAWTSAGKSLVFIGGLLTIAASAPKIKGEHGMLIKMLNADDVFIIVARITLGLFLLITGVQHFLFLEFVATLIPVWFPGNPVSWSIFAGVGLLLGGAGLLLPITAPLAAFFSGLMIFSWFWIIHIPRVTVSVSDDIAVFEALAFSGFAFMLAERFLKKFNNGAFAPGALRDNS